jgi:hypothetical protein
MEDRDHGRRDDLRGAGMTAGLAALEAVGTRGLVSWSWRETVGDNLGEERECVPSPRHSDASVHLVVRG